MCIFLAPRTSVCSLCPFLLPARLPLLVSMLLFCTFFQFTCFGFGFCFLFWACAIALPPLTCSSDCLGWLATVQTKAKAQRPGGKAGAIPLLPIRNETQAQVYQERTRVKDIRAKVQAATVIQRAFRFGHLFLLLLLHVLLIVTEALMVSPFHLPLSVLAPPLAPSPPPGSALCHVQAVAVQSQQTHAGCRARAPAPLRGPSGH